MQEMEEATLDQLDPIEDEQSTGSSADMPGDNADSGDESLGDAENGENAADGEDAPEDIDAPEEEPIVPGVVSFNSERFRLLHAHSADGLDDDALVLYFDMSCALDLDNTPSSIVKDVWAREMLLYLAMCHRITMSKRGGSSSGIVASVTEGSVSASFVTPVYNAQAQWYGQTGCGAAFWQGVKKYLIGGLTYVQHTY